MGTISTPAATKARGNADATSGGFVSNMRVEATPLVSTRAHACTNSSHERNFPEELPSVPRFGLRDWRSLISPRADPHVHQKGSPTDADGDAGTHTSVALTGRSAFLRPPRPVRPRSELPAHAPGGRPSPVEDLCFVFSLAPHGSRRQVRQHVPSVQEGDIGVHVECRNAEGGSPR